MDTVLEPLMNRPDLPQLVATLNEQLQRERESREAFLRDLTPDVKAEFIGGERVLHSPARAEHIRVSRRLLLLITSHVIKHDLGEVLFEKALIHLTRNDYEPDILFYVKEKAASITPDQMLFPAPDFIVEILSESTEKRDRGIKFIDYAAHGVSEYWIVDVEEKSVEQYLIVDGKYELSQKLKSGSVASAVIAGCVVPITAIFDEQMYRGTMTSTPIV